MAEENEAADRNPYREAPSIGAPNAGPGQGGQAKGGNAPQADDPTNPKQAAEHAAASNKEMQERGFGDHKGGDLGDDGTVTSD
ncbi:MAG: hypothetical protein ABW184_09830 [Sphingobium sp.]